MRQIITVLVIILGIFWYAGVGKEVYNKVEDKTYLSSKEVRYLHGSGAIGRPNYSKSYYSLRNTEYFYTRTMIPLVYHRDTISDSGLKYYSTNRQ